MRSCRLAQELNGKGLKTIVLQSGEDPYYTGEMIADIVRRIKSSTDMAVTLCVGERPDDDYRLWKEAGADRYLLRHETASRELYEQLHPDSDFDNRMRCLRVLRELGYQVGAGCMVGLPGQTIEHMADDVEFLRDFQPDMAGIGPYIPHPDTPLAGSAAGTLQMTLKMVALARIVTRDALLPATTAIGSIEEQGREMALMAGADVVMPNYTPLEVSCPLRDLPQQALHDGRSGPLRLVHEAANSRMRSHRFDRPGPLPQARRRFPRVKMACRPADKSDSVPGVNRRFDKPAGTVLT